MMQEPQPHMTREIYRKTKKKKKLRLKKGAFVLLFVIFLSLFIFSGYQLLKWHQDNQKIKTITDDINEAITVVEHDNEGELINPPENKESDYWSYIKVPFLEVDFTQLLQKNSDTVAFIHVENTNINYPVVQASDNSYYLTHAFDKSRNDAGWVYLDYRNQLDVLDDNTIIYGHGRLDTTVFGSLKNALTKSWQSNKDNYIVRLSTPTSNMVFQIFSVYTIEAESYYIRTTFTTPEEKEKWLQTMKERNVAPIDTEVNVNDKIITLSTCQNNSGGRIVVQAKLIKQEAR